MNRLFAYLTLALLLAAPAWATDVIVPLKTGSAVPLPSSPCQQNFVAGSNTLVPDTYICPSGGTLEWMFTMPPTYNPAGSTSFGPGVCRVDIVWWPPSGDVGGGCWMASLTVFPESNIVTAPTGLYDGDNWLTTQPAILIEGTKQTLLVPVEGHPYIYHLTNIPPQNASTGHPCAQDGTACVGQGAVLLVSYDTTPGACLGGSLTFTQNPRIKRVEITCPSS